MNRKSKWIMPPEDTGSAAVEFRGSADVEGGLKRASACVSAMGVYKFRVNGREVSSAVLAPGWTSYKNRVLYQRYDITDMLSEGKNTLSVSVGKGWARSPLSLMREGNLYADHPSAIFYLKLEYDSGKTKEVFSDGKWEVLTTPVTDSEIYDGETVDLTVTPRLIGAALPDKGIDARLAPQYSGLVTEHERVAARRLIISPSGERIIDFGQNLAGYVEIKITGKAGERVSISHAEVLDKDGNFYTGNLREAKQRDTYVLSGGRDILKPSYTYHGFRYIRIDEFPGEPDPSAFTAIALYSDMKRMGYFTSANQDVDRLFQNVVWGERSNFVDIPTDCPQRDERLGWTGDAQIFCRTASMIYDTSRFFDKWLADLAAEQRADGSVPRFCPMVPGMDEEGTSAGWGDAAVICPWELYRAYGDPEVIRRNFPLMRGWIEYMRSAGDEEYLWTGGNHFGDWLATDAGEGAFVGATQTDFIASAYYAYSLSLFVKMGQVTGEDMTEYEKLYTSVRRAFRETFMSSGMPVVYKKGDGAGRARRAKAVTQTSLAILLAFDLADPGERGAIAKKLVALIKDNGGKMSTGFIGTPLLLPVLSSEGYVTEAYNLLLQTKAPSWLYPVRHGATTMWEHWDSLRADGTFWSDEMNSFNHYAYGAVAAWLFETTLGIRQTEDSAGYSQPVIAPRPDRRLGSASGSLDTPHGKIGVSWRYTDESVRYEISIPDGMCARVEIPGKPPVNVTGGEYIYTT